MKQLLFLVAWMVIFTACKREVPAEVIQPKVMEEILYNIHLTDGIVANIFQGDSAKKVAAAYYKGIYKKYDVDSALFTKSMDFYNSNPVEMGKIYDRIVSRLEKEKKVLDDEQLRKSLAEANKAMAIAMKDSLTKLLIVDTTGRWLLKLDTVKIDYAKMSKSKIRSIKLKNDSIRIRVDSAKKAAEKKKEFVIKPRKAFFWGVNYN